jgi:hypothetical protein
MGLNFGTAIALMSFVVAFLTLVYTCRMFWAATGRRRRRRDERVALESRARQLTVSPHRITSEGQPDGQVRATAEAHNTGSQPLYEVFLNVHSRFLQGTAVAFTHQLDPGGKLLLDEVVPAAANPYPVNYTDRLQVDAVFRDADSYQWQRYADGTLRPPIDMRPIPGWRGQLVRIRPIGSLVSRWRARNSRPPLRELAPGNTRRRP